jgi:hypothetical protein
VLTTLLWAGVNKLAEDVAKDDDDDDDMLIEGETSWAGIVAECFEARNDAATLSL